MRTQGIITLIVGLVGMLIPMIVQWIAIARTRNHGFACPRCEHDVPFGATRCPNCSAAVLPTQESMPWSGR